MCKLTRIRKPLKPVAVKWRWLSSPIWPCALLPEGMAGRLEINGTLYLVLPFGGIADDCAGYRLTNLDNGSVYDLDPSPAWGWQCSCGDATFRPERPLGCKHARACREALAWLHQPTPPAARLQAA